MPSARRNDELVNCFELTDRTPWLRHAWLHLAEPSERLTYLPLLGARPEPVYRPTYTDGLEMVGAPSVSVGIELNKSVSEGPVSIGQRCQEDNTMQVDCLEKRTIFLSSSRNTNDLLHQRLLRGPLSARLGSPCGYRIVRLVSEQSINNAIDKRIN